MNTNNIVILFNKPFQVLSQFTTNDNKKTLSDFIQIPSIYPAGRLDFDSEGLLLLTNDAQLQHRITHPKFKLEKTYWAQVEGEITEEAIQQLRNGVLIQGVLTQKSDVKKINEPDWLWKRVPPIRERKNIPTSWVEIKISQGMNRQVRKMTAFVGFPTLRLVRYAIGDYTVRNILPGTFTTIDNYQPKSC